MTGFSGVSFYGSTFNLKRVYSYEAPYFSLLELLLAQFKILNPLFVFISSNNKFWMMAAWKLKSRKRDNVELLIKSQLILLANQLLFCLKPFSNQYFHL